jgi:nicotinate-nucleotide adenylyltransferase
MKNHSILVFGGSFDPPHKYHIEILKSAIKKIKPDKTIIIPTYLSPFKEEHFSSYIHRKKMIGILLKKNRIKYEIDDFELKRNRKTYTYQIARYLTQKYPNSTLYFLMGSDSFENIERWKKYKEVLRTFIIVVAKRKGFDIDPKKIKKYKPVILKKSFENLSSTQIRKEILVLKFIHIDKSIKKYIIKNKLYYTDLIKHIQKISSKKRFKHTLSVIKTSLDLAEVYGVNIKKAFLGALLHDATKDFNIKKQIDLIRKSSIKIRKLNTVIKKAPQILHQWASCLYAMVKLNIKDKEVISAISKHATGDKNMRLLDKIIYVSDFASDDRNFIEAKMIRKMSFKNIDKAFEKAKEFKRNYLIRLGKYIYE